MRRGRRHPENLRQGEALDFWRVEMVESNHLLRLHAEMKMPGQGWLQFEANSRYDGRTDLVQTAYFASKGISGLIYWYSLYPIHRSQHPTLSAPVFAAETVSVLTEYGCAN